MSDFAISFPIWTVVDAAIHKTNGFPLSLRTAGSPGYGAMFPLFTREAAAMLWGASIEKDEIAAFAIEDKETLIRLMGMYEKVVVHSVAINPLPDFTVAAEQYFSFNTIRAALSASDG